MARAYSAKVKKISASVEGAEEVIQMLKDMGKAAEEVLEQAADAGGRLALLEAKRRCPVRTGRLKESLHLQNGKKTEIKADVKIQPGKKEYYGTFVELGTKRMPARPFMRPAVDENKERISEAVTKEVSRALGRIR